jgi:hypothetical protein
MAESKIELNAKGLEAIAEIKERWSGIKQNVCESCMSEAIRHWVRNVDHECSDYDTVPHVDKYDGDVYSYAGGDIQILLSIIDMFTNN